MDIVQQSGTYWKPAELDASNGVLLEHGITWQKATAKPLLLLKLRKKILLIVPGADASVRECVCEGLLLSGFTSEVQDDPDKLDQRIRRWRAKHHVTGRSHVIVLLRKMANFQ